MRLFLLIGNIKPNLPFKEKNVNRKACCWGLSLWLLGVSANAVALDAASAWDKGLKFLETAQNPDGSWGKIPAGKVGVSAIVLEALSQAPGGIKDRAEVKAMMDKAAKYIVSNKRENGSIFDAEAPQNYCTSVAVVALTKYDRERFASVIDPAVAWIKGLQATEKTGYDPKQHKTYGGFGYGSAMRTDLSNTWFALDALKAAGVPADDPVWKNVQVFLKRCQNSTEVNDLPLAGNDGGAMYLPGDSAAGETKTPDGKVLYTSYGSMTYAMILSYIWADLKKDDLPVKLAAEWLGKNFSTEQNPNTKDNGQQGLYYYYRVMAKSLTAYGEKVFAGHDWREELGAAILKRQRPDGSWYNDQDRWSESDPALVTGYCLMSLALCQQP